MPISFRMNLADADRALTKGYARMESTRRTGSMRSEKGMAYRIAMRFGTSSPIIRLTYVRTAVTRTNATVAATFSATVKPALRSRFTRGPVNELAA
jgi:hypothetical protein